MNRARKTGVCPQITMLARAYKNATANEIVIAYGGTTFEEGMKTLDWFEGNTVIDPKATLPINHSIWSIVA